MKKNYTAPLAEITLFSPADPIATSWKKENATGTDRWWLPKNGFNYWGENIASIQSAQWYDFGEEEINPISKN